METKELGALMEKMIEAFVRQVKAVDPEPVVHKDKPAIYPTREEVVKNRKFQITLELHHDDMIKKWNMPGVPTSNLYLIFTEVPAWAKVGTVVKWKMIEE
jgi:hypothetical protein